MESSRRLGWPALLLGAVSLLAIGAAIGFNLRRPPEPPTTSAAAPALLEAAEAGSGHGPDAMAGPPADSADAVVTLTPEMTARAGIHTVQATAGTSTAQLRIPGVVQPNAYKEIVVTSLVSGRVTQVLAELGQRVMAQGQLATIYSPELADAQTAFIAARAEQTAHSLRQTRTQRLTAIGAATREELEMHESDRVAVDATVEVARARLALLGISEEQTQRLAGPQDVITTSALRAPLAGVVTRRAANVGLNIDPSMPLFTIVDLSTVWAVADLYERDFARVRIGSPATITSSSYPRMAIRGVVGYIDPQVQQETRTAKLRVEIPNPGNQLRLGMYIEALVGEPSPRRGVFVPKSAVQIVGPDSVVYLAATQPGQFIERKVEVSEASGDQILVVAGLKPGDLVVSEGNFFVRAALERLRGGRP